MDIALLLLMSLFCCCEKEEGTDIAMWLMTLFFIIFGQSILFAWKSLQNNV
jgi:hypothetical protein